MLGKAIQEYLEATHRKQTLLCETLGLSQSTVSEILKDKRTITANEYFKICDALDVPLEKFKNAS